MPKLIKDAKETIIRQAKNLLLQEGFSGFNMRKIAESAGVASGTLYNYFPSKDHLIVSVMLEDWEAMLARIEKETPLATSATEGFAMIFHAIHNFADLYRATWQAFRGAADYPWIREKYHKSLIDQLCEQILPLGARFDFLFDPTVAPFISEVLLTGAAHPQGEFRYLIPCLKRLVGEQ